MASTALAAAEHPALVLDTPRIRLDRDGVQDFLWPLPWADYLAARDSFMAGLAALLRPLLEAGDEDGELLAILAMEYGQEWLRHYYAGVVSRRCAEAGARLVVPERAFGTAGELVDRLTFLRGRFPASSWRSALRPFYGLAQNDGLSWRWPATVDFQRTIIATNPCKLTRARAARAGEKVVLVSMRHWFGELAETLPEPVGQLAARADLLDAVIALSDRAAGQGGAGLSDADLAHLRRWLIEATGLARHYLRGLARHPERLPRRLWTGSGGYIFRRLLHVAVRRAGGQVTSHDHGTGLGFLRDVSVNFTEFVTPDVFTTFNQAQADGYRRIVRDAFRLRPQWPEVRSIPSNATGPAPRARSGPVRRVMFVSSQYRSEQIGLSPLEFNLVAVDFQARLFTRLRELGYEVILKAHPDSPQAPPADFERLGVRVIDTPLEKVMDQTDLFITEYLHSSALIAMLRSGKPLVFVDFGHDPLTDEAAPLFERRAAVVVGRYDRDNRAQVDWQELREAMRAAPELVGDTEFADSYLANV